MACKWLAQNVVSKVEVGETLVKIKKVEGTDLPTFKVELYICLDSEDLEKTFCASCKQFHQAFYINEQVNCEACNYTAFKKQMEEKLKIKKDYRKGQINS